MIRYTTQRWYGQITWLNASIQRLAGAATRFFQESRSVLHATGKWRRFWLVHFQKEYVEQQLSVRQGDCNQCGACCSMLLTCPMLTKQGGCLAYGTCRPQSCKTFPIDQRDINEVNLGGAQCGYRFNRGDSVKDLEPGID